MNITDVGHLTGDRDMGDDKMEKEAKKEGKTAWEIAEFYTKAFKKDLVSLNIINPDILCKATDHQSHNQFGRHQLTKRQLPRNHEVTADP